MSTGPSLSPSACPGLIMKSSNHPKHRLVVWLLMSCHVWRWQRSSSLLCHCYVVTCHVWLKLPVLTGVDTLNTIWYQDINFYTDQATVLISAMRKLYDKQKIKILELYRFHPPCQSGPPWSEELLRQLSYAIKNQLVASKAPSLVLYVIRDRWLPCTERFYYRRPYAIKNQRGASKKTP